MDATLKRAADYSTVFLRFALGLSFLSAVADRFVDAASAMQRDGFWWTSPALTNKAIKRRVLKEMLAHR